MITETKVKPSGLLYMLAVFFGMLAAPIQAQESSNVHPYLSNKYFVDLGYFFPDRTLKIHVDGMASGANGEIDFEDRLRLKKVTRRLRPI